MPISALLLELGIVTFIFSGLGWLLFKRCQFSILQFLAALLSLGLQMVLLPNLIEKLQDPRSMPLLFFFLAILTGVGIFLGVRSSMRVSKNRAWIHWLFYLAGLTFPVTVFPAVVLPFRLLDIFSRWYPIGVEEFFLLFSLWIFCFSSTVITLWGPRIFQTSIKDS